MENLKFDVEMNLKLGMKKLLTKDFKRFVYGEDVAVGYSVFMIPPEKVFEHYSTIQIEQNIIEYMKESQLDFLILLFAYPI